MRILFLPLNIASMQAITCQAFNQMDGVEAKCLTRDLHKYNQVNDSIVYLPVPVFKRSRPISSYIKSVQYRRQIKKWIKWADVLHYVWGPALKTGDDLKWAVKMHKPIFVEWVGSDIRDPEYLSRINSFYKNTLNKGYEYRDLEKSDFKNTVQNLFSAAGAIPTVIPEMSLFLKKNLFKTFHLYPHRLNVADYKPYYPSIENRKPLIVHSPSVKIGKGSNIITAVIEELKKENDFEFILLHDLSREKVLELIKTADIFIDQVIVGGYGMSSCEAMAYGKPVVCYIMKEVYEAGLPIDCPIVNANPDNLKQQLQNLIADSKLRNETGRKSRAFVEGYNEVSKITKEYLKIYKASLPEKAN